MIAQAEYNPSMLGARRISPSSWVVQEIGAESFRPGDVVRPQRSLPGRLPPSRARAGPGGLPRVTTVRLRGRDRACRRDRRHGGGRSCRRRHGRVPGGPALSAREAHGARRARSRCLEDPAHESPHSSAHLGRPTRDARRACVPARRGWRKSSRSAVRSARCVDCEELIERLGARHAGGDRGYPVRRYAFEDWMENDGVTDEPYRLTSWSAFEDDEMIADFTGTRSAGHAGRSTRPTPSRRPPPTTLCSASPTRMSRGTRAATGPITRDRSARHDRQRPAPGTRDRRQLGDALPDHRRRDGRARPGGARARRRGRRRDRAGLPLRRRPSGERASFYANYHFENVGWGTAADTTGTTPSARRSRVSRNTPIEVFETRYPLLTAPSGSPRQRRRRPTPRRAGTERILEVRADEITVSALFDRMVMRPGVSQEVGPGGTTQIAIALSSDDSFSSSRSIRHGLGRRSSERDDRARGRRDPPRLVRRRRLWRSSGARP